MTEQLKSCPFCGKSVAEATNVHELEECGNFDTDDCPCNLYEDSSSCSYKTVVCNFYRGGCGATSGWYRTEEEAIVKWNRRSAYEQMLKEKTEN